MSAKKLKSAMVAKVMTETELLLRYMSVLKEVLRHPPIGINRLADKTGIVQHKVRTSLRMLQQDRLIDPTNKGALPTEELRAILPRMKDEITECMDVMKNIKKTVDRIKT